jgi:hypothetical protein
MSCGEGEKQFGYGVVGYRGNEDVFELTISPDRKSSVLDAEMFTLAHSCKHAPTRLNQHTPIAILFFFPTGHPLYLLSSLLCPALAKRAVFCLLGTVRIFRLVSLTSPFL